jgi:hypothetical protein
MDGETAGPVNVGEDGPVQLAVRSILDGQLGTISD